MKRFFICDDENYLIKIKDKVNDKDCIISFVKSKKIEKIFLNKNIVFLYENLKDIDENLEDIYFQFIKKNITNYDYLNFSRISEFNFSDKNTKNFVKLLLINKFIDDKKCIIYLASNDLNKRYFKDLGFKKVLHLDFELKLNSWVNLLKLKIKQFLIIILNLYKEVFFCFFLKNKKKSFSKKKIIYSHVKYHWKINDNQNLEYAYLQNIRDYCFLISALRNNSYSLYLEKISY